MTARPGAAEPCSLCRGAGGCDLPTWEGEIVGWVTCPDCGGSGVAAPPPKIAILHHAGDGNTPPVRVPATVELAERYPSAVVLLGLECPEAVVLRLRLGRDRVLVCGAATDTVEEAVAVCDEIRRRGINILYVSTEPGHLSRAWIISWILHRGRGVQVLKWPSAPGARRDPLRRTLIDICRALWHRARI